jgi:hypothetical protein
MSVIVPMANGTATGMGLLGSGGFGPRWLPIRGIPQSPQRERRASEYASHMRVLRDTRRIWLPFVCSALCLAAAGWTGVVLTLVLIAAALWFFFDGVSAVCYRAGNLAEHQQ